MAERGRSSDSGLPPSPPSRPWPVASWRVSVSPHSGGTVPDLHRVPLPRSVVGASLSSDDADDVVGRGSRLAWAALIFALSWVPDLGTGLGGWDLVLRKLAHSAEYAILGALLARATARPGPRSRSAPLRGEDELHQTFVAGRLGAPLDVRSTRRCRRRASPSGSQSRTPRRA